MEAAGLQNLAKMWVRFPNGVQKYKSSIMVKHWGPRPRRYDVEFGSIPVSCAKRNYGVSVVCHAGLKIQRLRFDSVWFH